MSSKNINTKDSEVIELKNELEEKDKIIEELKNELKEEKLISSKTKEYLFVLENKNSIQAKKIKKLQLLIRYLIILAQRSRTQKCFLC